MRKKTQKKTKRLKRPKSSSGLSSSTSALPIQGLTALRGLAALYVMGFHFSFSLIPNFRLFPRGYLAVDFFFVLSGFIIMHVYASHFRENPWSWPAYKKFLVLRLARIYPIHLFGLLLAAAAVFFLHHIKFGAPLHSVITSPAAFIANLFLVNDWHLFPKLTWNDPAWSLSAEWMCYLLFPLFITIVKWGNNTLRQAVLYLLATLALVALILLHHRRSIDITFDFGVIRAVAEFIQGMVLYLFYQRYGKHFSSNTWVMAAAVLCAAAFAVPRPLQFLAPICFSLLILSVSVNRGFFSRLLESPPMRFLGDISLSIYLLHRPVGFFLVGIWSLVFGRETIAPLAMLLVKLELYFILVILLSWFTYRIIELPMRNVIRTRYASAKPVKS